MLDHTPTASTMHRALSPTGVRRVLNIGAGSRDAGKIHVGFRSRAWQETRLDIDPAARPDIVGSITDLRDAVQDQSFDAVWCSHTLEHLPDHDVVPALAECRRILRSDGFAIVTTPDLCAVARHLLDAGPDAIAYRSPAGPISALDMLFGHGRSLRAGHDAMAHRTGFTADRLGRLALEAGFAEARVGVGHRFDLWALMTLPDTDLAGVAAVFADTDLADLWPAPPLEPRDD